MTQPFDDFDTQLQPEDLQCDNPIDFDFDEADWDAQFEQRHWEDMNGEYPDEE